MSTNIEIAETIRQQLGSEALMMMGAKNLVAREDGLQFRIGTNAKRVTNIVIVLAADDTYTVEFWNIRGVNMRKLSESTMVYVDSLRATIEAETGLYLSLAPRRAVAR